MKSRGRRAKELALLLPSLQHTLMRTSSVSLQRIWWGSWCNYLNSIETTNKRNSHSNNKSGCYTLRLETDEVSFANAQATSSLRVVIPYANSPWLYKCRYNFRINKFCTKILRSQDTVNSVYKFQQHRCRNLIPEIRSPLLPNLKKGNSVAPIKPEGTDWRI